MTNDDLVQLFKAQLFSDLPLSVLEGLANTGFVQSEPVDAVLFAQGEMPRFLHVIFSGRVALVGSSAARPALHATADRAPHHGTREAIVEIFKGGDVVIAPAVILNRPYLMSARVIETSRIAFLPAESIRNLINENPGFSRATTSMLAEHWRLLARQLKGQKLRSGTERLAAYLVSLVARQTDVGASVELPLDRQTMASWLGMSPEHLSRSIAQLKSLGVVVSGRRASIGDIDRLRAFCLDDDLR